MHKHDQVSLTIGSPHALRFQGLFHICNQEPSSETMLPYPVASVATFTVGNKNKVTEKGSLHWRNSRIPSEAKLLPMKFLSDFSRFGNLGFTGINVIFVIFSVR